jgi:hypothetical protein
MATENNKNLKYTSKSSVNPVRGKLKDINSINSLKVVFNKFIAAVKTKHLS